MECHWVYQPYSRTDLEPSSWPTQKEAHVVLLWFSNFVFGGRCFLFLSYWCLFVWIFLFLFHSSICYFKRMRESERKEENKKLGRYGGEKDLAEGGGNHDQCILCENLNKKGFTEVPLLFICLLARREKIYTCAPLCL